MKIIKVLKIRLCGDYAMAIFKCPYCFEDQFQEIKNSSCYHCKKLYSDFLFDLSMCETHLISGNQKRPKIGKKIVKKLHDFQDGLCAYCYSNLGYNYHVEHIFPFILGGSSRIDNLVLSCPSCNLTASSFFFSSFNLKRDFILKNRPPIQMDQPTP